LTGRKPHIVIDVERMKHPYTGLYYFCYHLTENLMKHHAGEFRFSVLKPQKAKIPASWPEIPFSKWDEWRHMSLEADLFHGTWQMTKLLPKNRIPFILTIHDLNFLYTDKPLIKKKKFLNKIQKRIDRADAVTVISDYVKQDVIKHLDLKGKPVFRIYNGVELKEFPGFDKPRYRPARPFLFTLGTVLYKKHFHVLPRLLPGTDFELIIAGIQPDKDYVRRIMDEAHRHGVAGRVKLIGPVSDEEKYWYLKNAEAFVFPSVSEGFGLPPVEAMRLGKPVFLSTLTSLPEIGGEAAYYFRNFEDEHMRRVLQEGLEDYYKHNRREEILFGIRGSSRGKTPPANMRKYTAMCWKAILRQNAPVRRNIAIICPLRPLFPPKTKKKISKRPSSRCAGPMKFW